MHRSYVTQLEPSEDRFHISVVPFAIVASCVDMMIEDGLVDETRRLLEGGVFERSQTASQAIGYKEIIPYIRGEASLSDCVELLKTATRKYAKRQMTWFNSKSYAQKIDMDEGGTLKTFEDIVNISKKLF